MKQLDAKCRLKLADLGAENLLDNVDSPSRGCETSFLGDSDEVAEMAQLDVHQGRC